MIEIVHLSRTRVDATRIARDAQKLFKILRIPRAATCEIFVVHPGCMRELNKRFRGNDVSTTVLSFPVQAGFPTGRGPLLGEIYVCPSDIAARPAPWFVHKGRVGFHEKLMYYIIHGVLHLGGFDHDTDWFDAKRMEGMEQLIWYMLFSNL